MTAKSGNLLIDALAFSSWSRTVNTPALVTYSFLDFVPFEATQTDARGFAPLTNGQKQAVQDALAQWSSVANISFVDVSSTHGDSGQIRFGSNDQNAERSSGYSFLPDSDPGSFVFTYFNNLAPSNFRFSPGSFGKTTFLHEIGHAIGLKHPGDYNGISGSGDPPFLPRSIDNADFSLMSYNDGASFSINRNNPSTPMLLDVLAVQYLYGANMTYHTGNDVYRFTDNSAPQCIWDAGGVNTFDFSATTRGAVINLSDGEFGETAFGLNNVSIAFGVSITEAIGGSGNDVLLGNDLGDNLNGGAGDDTFFLGSGRDNIQGGSGRDTIFFQGVSSDYLLVGGSGGFSVQEKANPNNIDFATGIEQLTFSDITINAASLVGGTAPTLAHPLQDVYAGIGKAFNLQVPANTFADIDVGDSLRYSVMQANGNPLPNWLKFNPATASFSGTPDFANAGNLFVRVTATDNANMSVSSDFHITTIANYGQQFVDTPGGDRFVGSSALDNAVYAGNRANYTIKAIGNNSFTVAQTGGSVDTLVNVDRVRFADASVALDVNGLDSNGHGGQMYALYQSALGRVPDLPGLGYWINALDDGVSLLDVAKTFINSPEFVNTYSTLSTSRFVQQLYLNVLGRPGEASGLAFHQNRIDSGNAGRAEVLLDFTNSVEFQTNLGRMIGNGFQYEQWLS